MTETIKISTFKRDDGTTIRRIEQKTKSGWVVTEEPMFGGLFDTNESPRYMRPSREVSD